MLISTQNYKTTSFIFAIWLALPLIAIAQTIAGGSTVTFAGTMGIRGPTGASGGGGAGGATGATGATGASGPSGPTGSTGSNGSNGTNGHGSTTTSSSFVAAAATFNQTVSVNDGTAFPNLCYVYVTDGTTAFSGQVLSGGGSGSLVIATISFTSGASGNTVASGATVTFTGSQGVIGSTGPSGPSGPVGPAGSGGGSGAGGYRNVTIQYNDTVSVSLTFDALDVIDGSNNVATLYGATQRISLTDTNGALALDTGSVSIDKIYNVWELLKSDKSASTAIASLSYTLSGITLPTGFSGAYARRVGSIFTKHTAATLIISYQTKDIVNFLGPIQSATTSDGNLVLNGGTATSFTAISCASRVPSTSRYVLFQALVGAPSGTIANYAIGSSSLGVSGTIYGFNGAEYTPATGNLIGSFFGSVVSSSQQIYYYIQNSSRLTLCVLGYVDNI